MNGSPQRILDRLSERVSALALEAGFDAAGVAAAPEPGSPEDYAELRHFGPWIDAGRAGEMQYLKRADAAGRLRRSSLRIAIPWARSVIVCASNYNTAAPRSIDPAPEDSGWIARYAWTGQREPEGSAEDALQPSDYHKVLLRRLQAVEAGLHAWLNAAEPNAVADFKSRCYVDTGPVVERVYAKYAGIGWVGKNTCILNERLGSWLFLGVIVTSLDVDDRSTTADCSGGGLPGENAAESQPQRPYAAVTPDRCGSCTRCIEACPTRALTAPYQMDASLCISYLTIEKRGEIPEALRPLMGRQVFGCDICQDVCPWNRKSPIGADPRLESRTELVNPALEWLATLDDAEYARVFCGSPVHRARHPGLRRNVAIAMGNSGLRKFLPRLAEWRASDDQILSEAAAWATAEIESTPV